MFFDNLLYHESILSYIAAEETVLQPNAGAHLLPEAGARYERRLEAVRCSALILIEAPSPADHDGLLSTGKHGYEPGGDLKTIVHDAAPIFLSGLDGHARTMDVCLLDQSGELVRPRPSADRPPRPFGKPWPRSAQGPASRSPVGAPGTGSPTSAPLAGPPWRPRAGPAPGRPSMAGRPHTPRAMPTHAPSGSGAACSHRRMALPPRGGPGTRVYS